MKQPTTGAPVHIDTSGAPIASTKSTGTTMAGHEDTTALNTTTVNSA